MKQLIDGMLQKCEQATREVKDKSSRALIKNVLLILSAILTAGNSLGIYAAVTKKSRAKTGSFFFKDKISKNKIVEFRKSLENLENAQAEIEKMNSVTM